MDSNTLRAAGALIYSQNSGRYLWLLRKKTRHWAFPGGKILDTESVFQGLLREIQEEIGLVPDFQKIIPLEKFSSWDSSFTYFNFWMSVPSEFEPSLNSEHLVFRWCERSQCPKPLLPAVSEILNNSDIVAKITTAETLNYQTLEK